MTLTGGLPYFGGPGNNYSMHAIAEAIARCRRNRETFGLITALGYYSTKHSVGIYSGKEPSDRWSRTTPKDFQAQLSLPAPVKADPEPVGTIKVDAYTLWHDREGQPEYSIIRGTTQAGHRAWAQTPKEDRDVMEAMMREEWVGRSGKIIGRQGRVNLVEFT